MEGSFTPSETLGGIAQLQGGAAPGKRRGEGQGRTLHALLILDGSAALLTYFHAAKAQQSHLRREQSHAISINRRAPALCRLPSGHLHAFTPKTRAPEEVAEQKLRAPEEARSSCVYIRD